MSEAEVTVLPDNARALVESPADALADFARLGLGITRATAIATQLKAVVDDRNLAANIQGRQHLLVEAWLTVGAMVGLTPMTEWTRQIRSQDGELEGYEARVQVIRLSTGEPIGAAEASCHFDEQVRGRPRWSEKHAAHSMAQTRATSKALGQVLRWIPVLAGYSGTPAEEMPVEIDVTPKREKAPPPPAGFAKSASPEAAESRPASAGAGGKPAAPGTKPSGDAITEGKFKRLWAIAHNRADQIGVSAEQIVNAVCESMGITSAREIHWKKYDEIIKKIETFDPPAEAYDELDREEVF